MLKERLENVRKKTPLVHNITNYVTVNDCANIILACKASPIMSDDIEEAEEITSVCSSLNINIGTLNQQTIPSMFAAGKKANECGHLVVLDPVGAGASTLRTKTAHRLLEEINFAVIKGNISEIKTLALGKGTTKGVDADIADSITEETLDGAIAFAKAFSKKTGAIIVITGAIDIVTDEKTAYIIKNGHPMMREITGTGCMLSAMLASYLGANEDNYLEAAAACVCAMGLCGELAYKKISNTDGNSSYRNYIIDMVYNLTGDNLLKGAKYEMQ